jgi:NitT/TauT family transport system substrate-binding protein
MLGKKIIFALIAAIAFSALSPVAAQNKPALKIGIFADADSFPFAVCEAEGLFAQEGVAVELVRFQSAVERDSAFQAGSVDGIISDLLAALLAAQAGFPIKVASLTDGRYGIVAAPASKAKTLADLAGKPIGISSNTVIHYMVDTFMTNAGVDAAAIQLLPVPKMPVRLEMVLGGQIAAAGMPEPFISAAKARGAILLASTDDYGLGAGVLIFSTTSITEKKSDITKMYKAYWRAAQEINAAPSSYRSLLIQKAGFSEEAAKIYDFVVYKKPRLPSVADVERAQKWLTSKGLLKTRIDPLSLFDSRPIDNM